MINKILYQIDAVMPQRAMLKREKVQLNLLKENKFGFSNQSPNQNRICWLETSSKHSCNKKLLWKRWLQDSLIIRKLILASIGWIPARSTTTTTLLLHLLSNGFFQLLPQLKVLHFFFWRLPRRLFLFFILFLSLLFILIFILIIIIVTLWFHQIGNYHEAKMLHKTQTAKGKATINKEQ